MRRVRRRTIPQLVVGSLAVALLLVGCGGQPGSGEPTLSTDTGATTSTQPQGQVNPLGGGSGGGNEVDHYATIAAAVNDPENVGILGTVTDVRVTRIIGEEASGGLMMVGATVHVDAKISGRTLDKIGPELTVEFIGPTRVPAIEDQAANVVAEYKQAFDALGQAIWIVDNKDGKESAYYVLASSQCLFGEKNGAVASPGYVNSPDPGQMVTSAEKYASLADLADAMRAADKSR